MNPDKLTEIKDTALGIKAQVDQMASTDVPVGVMENTPKPVELGEVVPDPATVNSAVGVAQGFLDQQQTAADEAAEQAKTQTETVRGLAAELGGRSEERASLREDAGVIESQKKLADLTSNIRLATDRLATFDEDTLLGEEGLRIDSGREGGTKASFGAAARERRLQRAVDRTGRASALRTQIATAELLQNNISAAEAQIQEALNAKYDPLEQQLQLETQFLNRAWQVSDTKQRGQIEAQQMLITQQMNDISDAKDMVTNALPYATPEELQMINDPDLSPSEQREKAQEIVARGLRSDRAYELEQQRLSTALTQQQLANAIAKSAGPATTNFAIDQMNQAQTAGSVRNVLASIMGTQDIPGTQRSNVGVVFDVAGSLENFANLNTEGEFVGLGPVPGLRGGGGLFDRMFKTEDYEERIANRSQVEAINLKVQQWASGAALTDEQTKQVARITPAIGDSDAAVKQKTNQLYNFMLGVTETQLVASGLNIQFPEVDLFEQGDLVSGMSPEQLQQYDDILLEANQTTTPQYGTN